MKFKAVFLVTSIIALALLVGGSANAAISAPHSLTDAQPLAEAARARQNQVVVGFTLINAETNQELGPLTDGTVINLNDYANTKFNIRADVNPDSGGSVKFELNDKTRIDNNNPYALFGDDNGNYNGWRPKVGDYRLTATPYSKNRGRGDAGQSLSISFSVVRGNSQPTPPPASNQSVVQFVLVNADTNQDISPLGNGDVINLASLGTQNINVRADTNPSIVGSVHLELSGPESRSSTENLAPYALFGDTTGDYWAWTPAAGQYGLTAIPYTDGNGGGQAGASLSISFEVTNDNSGPTPTPKPTSTPAPTPAPTDPPSSSVPLCADHDPTAWHGLYDAAKNCHYSHEHKQDPNAVNDIFGPVGALYTGQEISYPWQTFSAAGTENEMKHGGYGWLVSRDMGCSSAFADGCLTDFRVQYHAIMAAAGAVTRFHSFWLEARGCLESNPSRCGIIRTGGWADYGRLEIDGQTVALPNDPSGSVSGRRIHYYNTGSSNYGTWYGNNAIALVAIQTADMWGLVNPSNPSELHLFCPDFRCRNNNSTMQAHAIGVVIPSAWDNDGDGYVTYRGYTDRYGKIVNGCTQVGLDCVPLEVIDMPVGTYQYRDDTHGLGDTGRGDFDVSPSGEYWITYPN